MGVIDTIRASQTIAFDTNILIYAFNQSGRLGSEANELLEKIKIVKPKVYISVIVFEEFLVQIYKKKLEKDIAYYEDFLTGGGLFSVVDMTKAVARLAAKIRAEYSSLRAPDAIHLASALEIGAKVFITTDRRIPKKIGKMRVEVLS